MLVPLRRLQERRPLGHGLLGVMREVFPEENVRG